MKPSHADTHAHTVAYLFVDKHMSQTNADLFSTILKRERNWAQKLLFRNIQDFLCKPG